MITVRPATADDLDFIIHSFLMGFWGSPSVRGMNRDEYFVMMRPRFKSALLHPSVLVQVACAEDDPSTLVGWAATASDTLIWAYVRKPMRGMGVCRAMLSYVDVTGYALASQHIGPPKDLAFRPHVGWTLFAHE